MHGPLDLFPALGAFEGGSIYRFAGMVGNKVVPGARNIQSPFWLLRREGFHRLLVRQKVLGVLRDYHEGCLLFRTVQIEVKVVSA